jgi:uncharacterized membrane protein
MNNEIKKEQASEPAPDIAAIVNRNIKALVARRREEENNKPVEERIADSITRFTGNMAFVYTHVVVFGVWILLNLGWFGIKPFDPSFVALYLIAALEAIFLSTFVLMSQNSLDAQADKRADLDLQISLLAEHEITRLLTLVTAIAKKLDIEEALDPEINELAQDVMPEKIMDTMEDHKGNRQNPR